VDTVKSGDAGATADSVDSKPDSGDANESSDASEAGGLVDAAPADVDWSDLLDDDTGQSDATAADAAPGGSPVGQLYAHTKDSLYRLDLQAKQFTLVGKFTFDKAPGSVTDIALDAFGKLFSLTDHDVFECQVASADCKWLTKLPGTGTYNGLTFVPKGTVDATQDVLIGIATDGSWDRIDYNGATAKVTKLGQYGGGWLSSGDAFSVDSVGTYATMKGKGTSDSLALIDPKSGKILQIVGETGAKQLYGLAWWAGVFYAFSNDGNVYTLDVKSAKASIVQGITVPTGAKWWGAGVSTRAAGTGK
jgi:hypothetical protein